MNNTLHDALEHVQKLEEILNYFKSKDVNVEPVEEIIIKSEGARKYTCNHQMYIFNLKNIQNFIKSKNVHWTLKVGNEDVEDLDAFVLLEALAIAWCTSIDNVVNDYMILVAGEEV